MFPDEDNKDNVSLGERLGRFADDTGRLDLKTQRGSCRASQEGPWLCTGWKSNMSQQEVRAELIEDIERADTDGVSGKSRKERRASGLCLGSGDFY